MNSAAKPVKQVRTCPSAAVALPLTTLLPNIPMQFQLTCMRLKTFPRNSYAGGSERSVFLVEGDFQAD